MSVETDSNDWLTDDDHRQIDRWMTAFQFACWGLAFGIVLAILTP